MAPNRRQAIIWTIAEPIDWRIYAALGVDEFNERDCDLDSFTVYLNNPTAGICKTLARFWGLVLLNRPAAEGELSSPNNFLLRKDLYFHKSGAMWSILSHSSWPNDALWLCEARVIFVRQETLNADPHEYVMFCMSGMVWCTFTRYYKTRSTVLASEEWALHRTMPSSVNTEDSIAAYVKVIR